MACLKHRPEMPRGSRWELTRAGKTVFVGEDEAARLNRIAAWNEIDDEVAARYAMSESGLIEHHRGLSKGKFMNPALQPRP